MRITTLAVAILTAACASLRPGAGKDLRVLVYNIHAGADAAGKGNIDRVAAIIRDTKADVVLLQEVDKRTRRSGGVDQPAELARLTGLFVAFGKSLDYQGGDYGIAILSRFPIMSDSAIHLPVTPPQERSGGSYEPRVALRAVLSTPTGRIAVLNTHLDPSGDDRWRRQEVATVINLAIGARALGAVLVGGDFNSTPESAVQSSLRASGLRDAWSECGKGNELTYPASVGTKRIDYLFLTSGISCSEGRVLDSQASDHRAVLFRVRLPK